MKSAGEEAYIVIMTAFEWKKCEPERKKYMHLSDAEYNAVLCMGTFHWNGYYREICLKYLSKESGYLPYYIVRMNDWVKEVRETAYILLCGKMKCCNVMEIVSAMPMLERLLQSRRKSEKHIGEILEIVYRRINEDLAEQHLPLIVKQELSVRSSFYRLITREQLLSRELMLGLLNMESYGTFQERILIGLFRFYRYSEREVNEYLMHKSSNVRYQALLQKEKMCPGVWEGIENMLLDRAKKIRDNVIYVLTKYKGFNAGEFYRKELRANGNRIALVEMGYYGTKEDLPLIGEYLKSDNQTVVRQALHAYGKVAGSTESDLYWKYLVSEELVLCREAYRIILANKIHYGADVLWAEYQKRKNSPCSEYIIYLLIYEPVWKRMGYLLELYREPDLSDVVRYRVEQAILRRNDYAVLSEHTADELVEFLERNRTDYPENMVKGLLFDIRVLQKELAAHR